MEPERKPLFELTAADLMTRDPVTIRAGMPVRDAARLFQREGIRGAPVVDEEGRCVGVLSVTDLARVRADPHAPSPACAHQERLRGLGGAETVVCLAEQVTCPLQGPGPTLAGRPVTVCRDPFGLTNDWQVPVPDALPEGDVRHCMTAEPATVDAAADIRRVARKMSVLAVHRLIVLDADGRPVGLVSASDLLAALAGADEAARACEAASSAPVEHPRPPVRKEVPGV